MSMLAEHPVYPEPHDFVIVKREKIKTRQVFNVDDFPLAIKDPKDSGVFRNGNKVTVKLVSQAPAYSLREFKVKKGDEVTLILTNLDKVEDLTHGFAIPKYDINFIVNPAGNQVGHLQGRQAGCLLVLLHALLPRTAP
jgi:nitrous-oxide reductase